MPALRISSQGAFSPPLNIKEAQQYRIFFPELFKTILKYSSGASAMHPEIPLEYMGFPEKWTDCFLWTEIRTTEIFLSPGSETTPIWKEK